MADRLPPALPWARPEPAVEASAKRPRHGTAPASTSEPLPATPVAPAAEQLEGPLFGLQVGDRVEVLWDFVDSDDGDNYAQWCPATLEGSAGAYALRYDPDSGDEGEGEVHTVVFLSPCRLVDASTEAGAAAPASDPPFMVWRRCGARQLAVTEADTLAGVDPAVYDDDSSDGGDDGPEDEALDAWVDRLQGHVRTLPVVEQQHVATRLAEALDYTRALVNRVLTDPNVDSLTREDVAAAAAQLAEEMAARRGGEDTQPGP